MNYTLFQNSGLAFTSVVYRLREGFLKPLARAMARGGGLIALRLGSLMVVFELPWGSDGSGVSSPSSWRVLELVMFDMRSVAAARFRDVVYGIAVLVSIRIVPPVLILTFKLTLLWFSEWAFGEVVEGPCSQRGLKHLGGTTVAVAYPSAMGGVLCLW
ncbi:unnamed protein product [Brassica napus]|uniref:(rape) hypothetical protein n=1 Tax=Brassica napus TaxID=3708 RepID=A0A816W2F9_BRANA|nr:unnamed protein product [Brassica napus]